MVKYIIVTMASLMFVANVSAADVNAVMCKHQYSTMKIALQAKREGLTKLEAKAAVLEGTAEAAKKTSTSSKLHVLLLERDLKIIDLIYDKPVNEDFIEWALIDCLIPDKK